MFERFTQPMRDGVTRGVEEARRRGDRRIGTDHLLVAVLGDPGIADAVGRGPDDARSRIDALDRAALAAVGVDTGDFAPVPTARLSVRVPFSSGAVAVMERSLRLAAAERAREIALRHLLLALLEREEPDPAAALLRGLEVDRDGVRRRLAA